MKLWDLSKSLDSILLDKFFNLWYNKVAGGLYNVSAYIFFLFSLARGWGLKMGPMEHPGALSYILTTSGHTPLVKNKRNDNNIPRRNYI